MHEAKNLPQDPHAESGPPQQFVSPELIDPLETEHMGAPHRVPAPKPSSHTRMSGIFLGSDGLWPIWRLFLYLAMARIFYLLLGASLPYFQRFDLSPLWLDMFSEFNLLLAAFIPGIIMARLEKRAFGDFGLPLRNGSGRLFCIGAIWGFVAISLLMLSLDGAKAFTIYGLALHGRRIFEFAVFWGVFFLIVSFAEEFLIRGYCQFTLTHGTEFWSAAVLLSIAFGLIHVLNQGEAWNGIVAAACIGFFFCLTLRRTGTLWFAVGFHAAWDWGESYLYSVPDSGQVSPGHLLNSSFHGSRWITGGSVGPEGSVLVFIVIAVLWILFDRMYPEVRYGVEAETVAVSNSTTINLNRTGLRENQL